MVDISSQNNKINVTVSSSGNTANTNVTPDYAQYYSEKSKEWAISNRIVDNTDYSSKYYANESKKQADISAAKATEVVESGNNAVTNIESARDNAIMDVNTAGATQVALATEQATIATNKASEVIASGNNALSNIDTAKNNAITSITNQETTSKTVLIDEGATQIGLIQNEGATQVANVQSTGFYMRDDKLYYINSQGEETEFKSGGSGLEICDIGMALYVDETKGLRRYLNGQIVDINSNTQAFLNRLQEITTLHPSLLCTESEWQTTKTMSKLGQCGKFVFNYGSDGITVVSVRLPAVVNINGLIDMANAGLIKDESLPNITGKFNSVYNADNLSGAFGWQGNIPIQGVNNSSLTGGMNFNASRSSSTYQDNAPVQQEAIQYPYFIQIATGSETENNIINEIELNNPYSLFDSKYSDHELNNLSWLKSEGQWNSKAVYPDAYDKLLKVYNGTETVEGLSVKLSTETYTDYDFVLNTSDETFRLPLKTKQKFYDDIAPVVGNGLTLGLTNGTDNLGTTTLSGGGNSYLYGITSTLYGRPVGSQGVSNYTYNGSVGLTTDSSKSGIETHLTETTLYLYFYVGETVQNANLIDAGRIGEQVATKTDMLQASGAGMPSNRYIDLTLGASGSTYTAPANGWFMFSKTANTSSTSSQFGMVELAVSGKGYYTQCNGAYDFVLTSFVPVTKGDIVYARYTARGKTNYFKFIYAEGSK